jgi:hypothetical protein
MCLTAQDERPCVHCVFAMPLAYLHGSTLLFPRVQLFDLPTGRFHSSNDPMHTRSIGDTCRVQLTGNGSHGTATRASLLEHLADSM